MIVCSCNQLTDRQVLESLTGDANARPRSPGQVYRCLGCKPDCGRCVRQIRQMFADITSGLASNSCQIGCAVCPGDAAQTLAYMIPAPTPAPELAQRPATAAIAVNAPAAAPWQPAARAPRGRTFNVPASQRFNAGCSSAGCTSPDHRHHAHAVPVTFPLSHTHNPRHAAADMRDVSNHGPDLTMIAAE